MLLSSSDQPRVNVFPPAPPQPEVGLVEGFRCRWEDRLNLLHSSAARKSNRLMLMVGGSGREAKTIRAFAGVFVFLPPAQRESWNKAKGILPILQGESLRLHEAEFVAARARMRTQKSWTFQTASVHS